MNCGRDAENAVLKNLRLGQYRVISDVVEENARVLDLGCGNGELLDFLREKKSISGVGVEIDTDCIIECIERGIPVIQSNLDEGLAEFPDQSFDYVLISMTIQVVRNAKGLLENALRVGRRVIITFPNFAHWSVRARLFVRGVAPVLSLFPYEWYNSPNIHQLSFYDLSSLCRAIDARVLQETPLTRAGRRLPSWLWPNLLALAGLFVLTRRNGKPA